MDNTVHGLDPSWRVTGEYDITDTYTRATDSRGHKEQLRVSMPPDLREQIFAFVSTQTIPTYQSPADLVRDAIVHRLQYWKDNTLGEWRAQWTVVFSAQKAGERAERVRQLRELPNMHKEGLTLAFDEGLYGEVIAGIEHLREVAPSIPDPVHAQLLKIASDFEDKLSAIQAQAQAMGLAEVYEMGTRTKGATD